jgi:3-hydroxyacyl-CoA dehydrogenase, NAD binding domain
MVPGLLRPPYERSLSDDRTDRAHRGNRRWVYGGGIAQVFAMAGLDVVICDADPDLTRRHLDRLRGEAEDFERQSLFITVIGKNRAYIRDILGALID